MLPTRPRPPGRHGPLILHTLKGHTDHVYTADFSRDGKRVVTASADERARIWDVVSGRLLHTLSNG